MIDVLSAIFITVVCASEFSSVAYGNWVRVRVACVGFAIVTTVARERTAFKAANNRLSAI